MRDEDFFGMMIVMAVCIVMTALITTGIASSNINGRWQQEAIMHNAATWKAGPDAKPVFTWNTKIEKEGE